jgi:hypothetical protein
VNDSRSRSQGTGVNSYPYFFRDSVGFGWCFFFVTPAAWVPVPWSPGQSLPSLSCVLEFRA